MTAAKTAIPSTYVSGFCGTGRHEACRGSYAGVDCSCDCGHQPAEPEPEPPLLEVGAHVVCAPGTCWAGEDLSGAVLEVVEVHTYPPEISGPVFVCRWPGTTTSAAYGVVVGAEKVAGATT